jgi:hypothetical protein
MHSVFAELNAPSHSERVDLVSQRKALSMAQQQRKTEAAEANLDPISGEPGAHPAGVGLGAAGAGAAAGALGGAAAGPVGAVVGAVVGGIAGGYAGKGIAESIDPTIEDAYWREHHMTRPYYESGTQYNEYQPAYQYGWESRSQHSGRTFEEAEPELQRGWPTARGGSRLDWPTARAATRDAWDRIENTRACDTRVVPDAKR